MAETRRLLSFVCLYTIYHLPFIRFCKIRSDQPSAGSGSEWQVGDNGEMWCGCSSSALPNSSSLPPSLPGRSGQQGLHHRKQANTWNHNWEGRKRNVQRLAVGCICMCTVCLHVAFWCVLLLWLLAIQVGGKAEFGGIYGAKMEQLKICRRNNIFPRHMWQQGIVEFCHQEADLVELSSS